MPPHAAYIAWNDMHSTFADEVDELTAQVDGGEGGDNGLGGGDGGRGVTEHVSPETVYVVVPPQSVVP